MLILPIEEARPGMVLALPVAHPEHPDQDLLKAKYILEADVINRLNAMGVIMLYIDYPGLDELDRHVAVNLSPARQKLYEQIKQTVVAGQKHAKPVIAYSDYYSNTRELITTLVCQGQHPVYIEHMSSMGGDAITHATAVAHLGLLLGIKLEPYLIQQRRRLPVSHAKEVVNIGVAGMLHDIGKLSLPAELQKYTDVHQPHKPDERARWQQHVSLGYEMVRGGIEPSAAGAVMNHHQHWDGTGFPATVYGDGTSNRPKETRIHIFARIVAVADLYDRLAVTPGVPGRRTNLEVLHLMRTRYASWCDPTIVKTLAEVTPPFPPGAIVRLSDDTSAVVVDIDPDDPYQPVVKHIVGRDLELDEKRVELNNPDAPTITHLGKLAVEGLMPQSSATVSA